jgi:two-component system, sensor histidine kinase YesM
MIKKIHVRGWKFFIQILKEISTFLTSSIKRKMIFIMVGTLFVVVLIINAVTFEISTSLQINDAKANDAMKVQFIIENLDETVSSINSLVESISQDSEIQSILGQSQNNQDSIDQINKVLLSKTTYSSEVLESLYLFDGDNVISRLNFQNSHNIYGVGVDELRLKKHRYDTVGRINWRMNDGKIYIDKAIRQRDSLKLIGYITISLKKDYLKQRLQSEEYRYTYVFDENGNNLVSSNMDSSINSEELFSKAKKHLDGQPILLKVEPFGDMLFTTNISEFGDWRVVSLVPVKEIAKGSVLIGWWIIVIGLFAILLGIIITWISTNRIIAPLYDLKEVMDQVETENFQYSVDIYSNDEFGRLGRSFNRMMEKINYLISEVFQRELAQKESEYKALKAQINPHFLYNTLDTIRWLSVYKESEKVEKVAISLAQLLKASLMEGKEMIPIKNELEYINAYLYIQKNRFQDIDVSIHINDSIEDLFIPRFVLQPLVENSFVHGLENKVGKGSLTISATAFYQDLKIRLIDDGVGINEEELKTLLEASADATPHNKKGTGNGLKNVHRRIQSLYGDKYGLSIQSSLNIGTIVEITIPILQETEVSVLSKSE